MKKILISFIALIILFLGNNKVYAGANISANASSIYVGDSVTVSVTVTEAATWEIHIGVSGAASASNCSGLDFADGTNDNKNTTRTYTVTCKPQKTGTINFIINSNSNITNETGNTSYLSGSTSVSVINRPVVQQPVQKPATNNTITPKSSVNYLSSLEVEGKKLSPNFNKETVDYTVELEAGTTSININAATEHNRATIIGNGVKSVSEGINNFEIIVTAENGSKRTYKLKVNVKEKDPILVNVNGKEYTVIRKKEHLPQASAFYSESSTKINEEEIPSYYGEITGYTLIGLKDSEGNINLFIYDEENNNYYLYREFNFSRIVFYPTEPDSGLIPKGFSQYSIIINDVEIPCYKKNKEDSFALIYGVNIENNNEDFYVYDAFENTLQRYDNAMFDSYREEIIILRSIIAGLICIVAIILVVSALQGSITKNNKKSKSFTFLKSKTNTEDKKTSKEKNTNKENAKEAKLLEKELKRKEKEEIKKNKRKKSLDDTNIIDITNINIKRK